MDDQPSARSALALVIVGAFVLAGIALFLTVRKGDVAGALFQHPLTIQLIAGIVAWSLLAWAARRLIVGKLSNTRLNLLPVIVWGGSRVSLLIAVIALLAGWLTALAGGLEIATLFGQALILLVVVAWFTGMIGGAFLNSLAAVRSWRGRST